MLNFRRNSASPATQRIPLTSKAFYDLVGQCEKLALELTRLDPTQVNLEFCHRFNNWLPTLQRYDQLNRRILRLRPARPIARWQLMTLIGVVWMFLALGLPGRVERLTYNMLLFSGVMAMLALYWLPQHLYGTTVELLEGKVLLVVESLLAMLQQGEIPLTEAAFFRAKETLETTQHELRQQIDLAHRRESEL